jgi:hypothetical protein
MEIRKRKSFCESVATEHQMAPALLDGGTKILSRGIR